VDTIVAAATPPGRGGVSIVRLSGPAVPALALSLLGARPAPRVATTSLFRAGDGTALDEGLALFFPAPHSYTGEDVLELHAHGSPVLVEALINRALELGARRASPGEFTQRAYLNHKLDLAQAEAVADLIDAGSLAAARAALRSLQGEFSARVHALDEALARLRAHVEAGIDFPADEVDELGDAALTRQLADVATQCEQLQTAARQGRVLTEGLTVVIAGAPNAGKSTLLNRLAGHEAAIVTDVPGTTRDVLRERILFEGVPVTVLDTAGLRETGGEAIEMEGIRRARAAMTQADRILFLVDAAADPHAHSFERERAHLPAEVPVTLVYNKIDLPGLDAQAARRSAQVLAISGRTGAGLDALRRHVLAGVGFESGGEGLMSARSRHLEALRRVAAHLTAAEVQRRTTQAGELVAEELRAASVQLGLVVGQQDSEALLGRIFSTFCIGK